MTKTELSNIALGHLGHALISSIDEVSPAAQHIRRMWDYCRDGLLRQRHWNFALERSTLSRLTIDPAFGWACAFQLPSDYLLAIELNGREAGTGDSRFDIEGQKLLCDEDAAELRYIRVVEEVTKWDASFCEAFAYKLAAAVAPSITSSSTLTSDMNRMAEMVMVKAFGPDNLETRPRVVLAQTGSGYLAARQGRANW